MAANTDPKATTQKDCVPIGAPAVMFYPVADTITVNVDRCGDEGRLDGVRNALFIWDGASIRLPATRSARPFRRRWEGDTLVVETTNFKEHPMGLPVHFPAARQKHLTERFRLGADHKNLIYYGVIEDPVVSGSSRGVVRQWQYRPDDASLE